MGTHRRRLAAVGALTGVMMLGTAGSAFALHCPHPHKPLGAGAVSGPSEAGNSGKAVLKGGFVDGSEVGSEHDIFLRGPDKSFGTDDLEGMFGVDLAGDGYGSLKEGHPFFEEHED